MSATFRAASGEAGSGVNLVVPRPDGTQPGDPLYAVHSMRDPFDDVPAPPGWAPVHTFDSDIFRLLYTRVWKRAAPSGSAPFVFPQHPFTTGVVIIAAAYGVSPNVVPRIQFVEAAEIDNIIPTPGVTPASPSHLEIRIGMAALDGPADLTPPAGYQPRGQARIGSVIAGVVASRQISSSTSSGVKNFRADPAAVTVSHGVTISLPSADVEPDPDPPAPEQPGLGDALFQYSFSRYLDRTYLGHLDLSGVSYEKRINRLGQINSGPFTGQLAINSPERSDLAAAIVPRDPLDLTRGPGVICVDILRGGQPHGQYWIVGATVSKTRRQVPVLELRGLEIDAYWGFVELQESLGELTGDREDLARQLLEHLAAQPHADLGLVLQSGSSGSPVTRVYTDAAQATYGRHLAELTEGVEGFEHCVNIVAGVSDLERHWVHGAPLGDPDAPHSFSESPTGGDILDWSFEIAPLRNAVRWRARSETENTDASTEAVPLLSSVHESTPHLVAGWPRIDRTIDRPGVFDLETLEDYAARWAATASGAQRIWKITVLAGENPSIGPNSMGDGVSVSMINEYFPRVGTGPGYDERHRLIGLRVVPISKDSGKDEFELYLQEPEVIE